MRLRASIIRMRFSTDRIIRLNIIIRGSFRHRLTFFSALRIRRRKHHDVLRTDFQFADNPVLHLFHRI